MDDERNVATDNIVYTALEAGKILGQKVVHHPNPRGMPFIVLPSGEGGSSVHLLAEDSLFDAPPDGKTGKAQFFDIDSFLKYWDEHKGPQSRIYAQMEPVSFTAVFDEHVPP